MASGLRGGRITSVDAHGGRRLEAVRYTEDVSVSGLVQSREGRAAGRARLSVHGANGLLGTLTLRWNAGSLIAEGRLQGRSVRVRAGAP